jgi:perosamine synthetase
MITALDKSQFSDKVVSALKRVVGSKIIGLHDPVFKGNEWIYLKECLDSNYVSSVGKFVEQFESELAIYTGAKHAIAVVNGTSALHIALKLAGVKNNDEVLVPALTFVATANAVTYCNATPHFVDIEEKTLGIDAFKLRDYLNKISFQQNGNCINKDSHQIIRALVVVHAFGHSADIEALTKVSKDFNITLIEDAAESIGSYYDSQHTGTFGLFGVLSFNGNKTITTGGGGALLTDNTKLAKYAKHLTTTAKIKHSWEYRHDEIGFNYRMPNINAALGCAQLEQLPNIIERKRKLYKKYKDAFSDLEGVKLIKEPKRCRSNYWLQTLILDKSLFQERDLILKAANDNGIMTRPAWHLLHELAPFENNPRMDLSFAISISNRLINIPSNLENE